MFEAFAERNAAAIEEELRARGLEPEHAAEPQRETDRKGPGGATDA